MAYNGYGEGRKVPPKLPEERFVEKLPNPMMPHHFQAKLFPVCYEILTSH
jgi:hypothetical protein